MPVCMKQSPTFSRRSQLLQREHLRTLSERFSRASGAVLLAVSRIEDN